MLRPLWLALGLLTRFPVPSLGEIRTGEQGRSLLWYPLAGLLIGLLLTAAGLLLRGMDPLLASALLVSLWAWSTGALHLDGLADSADAWLGGQGDRERALRIMKDPACGPVGVVAILLVLLLKVAAVQALLGQAELLPLILAPLLARALLPLLFMTTNYVRQGGMASQMVEELPRRPLILALACIASIALIAGPWSLLAALAAGWGARRLMLHRLGGTTGDTAGAMVEVVEAAVLVVSVLARN